MNKNVLKMIATGLACVALCGTTLAAPRAGNGGRAPRHRAPAPAPHHHGGHHEGAGWVALGATVIGGIVGGIIGACN